MIVVLLNSYIALLALFVWLKFIPFNTFWKISPVIVLLLLLVGLFIPMGWGAPSGPVVVGRNSVQIVPSVAGEVVEVPVMANTPVKEGDVLFRIDPTTYEAQVKTIEAQLKFAELRRSQFSELQSRDTGRAFDVQQREAEVQELQAQLEGAKWNLDRTTVRAPADGYVTNLALRKGARVTAQSPVMAFIDTSETIFAAEIAQIYARYIEVGQPVEITFKTFPGEVFAGTRRGRAAGHRDRADSARRTRRRAYGCSVGAVRRPLQARRPGDRETPACRKHRPRGDLHRARQGSPCHPQGRAAPDGHRELHQSVLMLRHDPRRDRLHAGHCANTLSLSIVSIWCR